MTSTVALFGASGFIGRAIYKELENCGFSVISFYSHKPDLEKNKSSSSICVDFHNTIICRKIIGELRPDIIISTPWVTALPDYRTSPLNLQFKNSTIKLAQIALEFQTAHFIALGSSAEYGDNNLSCDAASSFANPLDLYSQSKYETYLEISRLFKGKESRFNWLRVFQPFGENQDSNRLIPYLASELSAQRSPILKEPNRISDWISSQDIAAATIFSINNILPELLDVGSGIGTRNWELVDTLIEILQVDVPKIAVDTASLEHRGLVISNKSPIFQSGWQPRKNLYDSLLNLFGSANK